MALFLLLTPGAVRGAGCHCRSRHTGTIQTDTGTAGVVPTQVIKKGPLYIKILFERACCECSERNTPSLGRVPMSSRGSHGDPAATSEPYGEGAHDRYKRARRGKRGSMAAAWLFSQRAGTTLQGSARQIVSLRVHIGVARRNRGLISPDVGAKLEQSAKCMVAGLPNVQTEAATYCVAGCPLYRPIGTSRIHTHEAPCNGTISRGHAC